MLEREVPKINRDKFPEWKILVKLHLGELGDHAHSTISIEHVDPVGVLTIEDLKMKK